MSPEAAAALDFHPLPADPRDLTIAHVRSAFNGDVDAVLRDIVRLSATRPDAANAGANEPLADAGPRRLSQRQPHPMSVPAPAVKVG